MDELRLEETVYSIQPQTERTTEKLDDIRETEHEQTTEIKYMGWKKLIVNMPNREEDVVFT